MEDCIGIVDYVNIAQMKCEVEDTESTKGGSSYGARGGSHSCGQVKRLTKYVNIFCQPLDQAVQGGVTTHMTRPLDPLLESTEPQIIIGDDNAIKVKICQNTDEYMLLELTVVDDETSEPEEKHDDIQSIGYVTEYMTEENMLSFRDNQRLEPNYVNAKYKCDSCIIVFNFQCQLDNHNMISHVAKECKKQCIVCLSYVENKSYANHVHNHYIARVCQICSHIETHWRRAKKHVRSHYEDPAKNAKLQEKKKKRDVTVTPGTSKYRCCKCDAEYDCISKVKRHYRYKHVERPLLTCKKCHKQSSNRATFKKHQSLCDGDRETRECIQCGEEFTKSKIKKGNLNVLLIPGTSIYRCSMCDAKYECIKNARRHYRYKHAELNSYTCNKCQELNYLTRV